MIVMELNNCFLKKMTVMVLNNCSPMMMTVKAHCRYFSCYQNLIAKELYSAAAEIAVELPAVVLVRYLNYTDAVHSAAVDFHVAFVVQCLDSGYSDRFRGCYDTADLYIHYLTLVYYSLAKCRIVASGFPLDKPVDVEFVFPAVLYKPADQV